MKNVIWVISVLFLLISNVSYASEKYIESDNDLVIKFSRIDNRVVLKLDGNTIWDETFHSEDITKARERRIPHKGYGKKSRLRVEIWQAEGNGHNPWGTKFTMNSNPPVNVTHGGDNDNRNVMKAAWDYTIKWD